MLEEAAFVWNHALALQRRYYRIYHGYISLGRMKTFFKKIHRHYLVAQTAHEILERLDASYQRFFSHLSKRPPKFKSAKQFRSFVYKQNGYKLYSNLLIDRRSKKHFKFSLSRPYLGNIKRITVKRISPENFHLFIVTDDNPKLYHKTHNGAMVGIDFGLKTFLTLSDGDSVQNPEFYKTELKRLRQKNKQFSFCKKKSHNYYRRLEELQLLYRKIANKRNDWQWKVAHQLCKKYDLICVEDLNIASMMKMWGRKVNDLAFSDFLLKLKIVAGKYGCSIKKVDRFFASSKICSSCGYTNNELTLQDRTWICPECGTIHDRDLNAAKNILRQGIVSHRSPNKTKIILRKGRKSL